MKRLTQSPWFAPLTFLGVCVAAYGLLIPWLGFYWDDWPFLWFSHTLGPTGLIEALAGDRPFLAAIYMLTTSLLGQQPVTWQIFGVLTHWLTVLSLWWALLQVWPDSRRPVTWVALAFAVYPGFQQSFISVIYSQAYLLLAAFFLSLGVMVKAVRVQGGLRSRSYVLLTVAALLLSAFAFFSTEYFFGIELIRPLLIWFALAQAGESAWLRRARSTLLHWLPYLVEFGLFFVYRAFLSPESAYPIKALDQLQSGFASTLWSLIETALSNAFTSGWTAWTQIFSNLFSLDWTTQAALLFGAVSLASLIVLLVLLPRLSAPDAPQSAAAKPVWALQAILLGALALLAASLPFWAGGLPLSLSFPYDRFNLAMIFGASLLLVGMLEFFIRTSRQKIVLLALTLSLAIGFHFQSANSFRRDWETMQRLVWQITWRMPALEPGTMLLTYEFPLKYYSDNSLSAALNWVYAPENHTRAMPYILNYISVRLNGSLPGLEPGLSISQSYRAMRFRGNTSQTVVLAYNPPGCLRVLDPLYNNAEAIPGLNRTLVKAIPLNSFAQIIADPPDPTLPSSRWYGVESTRTWCYYLEKAELARQQGNWQAVQVLGSAVLDARLKPGDSSEWMVFMEGFARSGDWQQAVTLGARMMQNEPALKAGVCQTWQRIMAEMQPGADDLAAVQAQQDEIGCEEQAQP